MNGSRETATLPDGSTWTYLYDEIGRLTQLDDAKTGRSTRTTEWLYSDDGLLTRRDLSVGGTAIAYTLYSYGKRRCAPHSAFLTCPPCAR